MTPTTSGGSFSRQRGATRRVRLGGGGGGDSDDDGDEDDDNDDDDDDGGGGSNKAKMREGQCRQQLTLFDSPRARQPPP